VSDEQQRVRYRYTGDGTSFLEGIPARDLTEEDVAALDDVQRAAVEASDLYEAAEGGEAKE
jgi:hypothetical protein